MSASLVGSEMCIRDRTGPRRCGSSAGLRPGPPRSRSPHRPSPSPCYRGPVSYTHLTLPTICSV
eukprot:1559749-Alexandrium_andersonii.AAC.1